jgi:hypothetical protein
MHAWVTLKNLWVQKLNYIKNLKEIGTNFRSIDWRIPAYLRKFVFLQALGPRALNTYSMYKGSQIRQLDACGLELEAYCLGLDACYLELAKLGA